MVSSCIVPRCKRRRRTGLSYYRFPVKDAERCKLWLRAVNNPKYDENTALDCLKNHRVCSLHFKPEDFERHLVWEAMGGEGVRKLRATAIPSLSLDHGETSTCVQLSPAQGLSTSSQASSLGIHSVGVDTASPFSSQAVSSPSGATSFSSLSPPPAGLSLSPFDRLNETIHQETESSSATESKSDETADLSQSKTIVNDSCLMELFKKCQMCGQTIIQKKVSQCGAQKKVRWSCLSGHRGIWMSSPYLWEAFPEIHLLTTLSVLFSGGTFTHFKKWAKHLHLHFMGNKTFFEIQKAYLNPVVKQMSRTELEVHQQPEGTFIQIKEDGHCVSPRLGPTRTEQHPLKKIKSKLMRREKGLASSRSSYEPISPVSSTFTKAFVKELTARSHDGHVSSSETRKQCQHDDVVDDVRKTTHGSSEVECLQDSFEEMDVTLEEDEDDECNIGVVVSKKSVKNVTDTTEPRAAGADDNCHKDVYVPVIAQRSTTSELLLECEEEELEPWQKQPSQVDLKDEHVDGELTDEETDCKSEPLTPPSNVENTSPPGLKMQTPQLVVFNSQGFIAASPQLTRKTEFVGSLGTKRPPRSSFTIVPAGQQQKVITATVTPESYAVVPSSIQIHNPASLSSFKTPAVYATSSNQEQTNQSSLHSISAAVNSPCFPHLNLNQTINN